MFASTRDGGDNKEIYMVNLGDISQTNLTNSEGDDYELDWRP